MTAQEERENTTAWGRVRGFLLDWVKSLALYAVVVAAGTLLFLIASSIVGYLAYSNRPGPGWGRGTFSWSEVKFFVGWLPFLIYFLLYFGAALFPFVRLLSWFRSPRWLLRVFGGCSPGLQRLLEYWVLGGTSRSLIIPHMRALCPG
jgi:hypothetical protein